MTKKNLIAPTRCLWYKECLVSSIAKYRATFCTYGFLDGTNQYCDDGIIKRREVKDYAKEKTARRAPE